MNDPHREILRLCILFVDTDTKWWGGGLERLDFDFFSHVSFVRVPSPGCELPPPAADHRTAPAHPCAQGGLMI